MTPLLALALAYLVGSIPAGFLATRLVAGDDIRAHGSGGTGATNVQRVLGWRWGLAIALADVAKGAAAVLIARGLGASELVVALCGAVAVAAHCWPVWLGFRGGKGVATGGGAAIALTPWGLVLVAILVIPVVLTRYVSLGSVTTALAAPALFALLALAGWEPWAYVAFGAIAAPVIVYQHRGNIQRLRNGVERKLGDSRRGAATA